MLPALKYPSLLAFGSYVEPKISQKVKFNERIRYTPENALKMPPNGKGETVTNHTILGFQPFIFRGITQERHRSDPSFNGFKGSETLHIHPHPSTRPSPSLSAAQRPLQTVNQPGMSFCPKVVEASLGVAQGCRSIFWGGSEGSRLGPLVRGGVGWSLAIIMI